VRVLGWDTATPATAVALLDTDAGPALEERDDPPPGARPAHAAHLLAAAEAVLACAELTWAGVDLLACGVGPGSFTGLRIGVATARAAALARGLPLAGVSTLEALAAAAAAASGPADGRLVVAVLDARRGEAFAAAWGVRREPALQPSALAPEALAGKLAELPGGALAVGDGAVRFRAQLDAAGAVVPPDASPLHRVSAEWICRLAARGGGEEPGTVLPHYIRPPDAQPRRERSAP
jgi:tRNA threonylcarbamoyladenosine biosynthesis protein TsaB